MTFTTKDKTLFQLPALDRAEVKAASPRTLMTELFQANATVSWKQFKRKNIEQIMHHIAKQNGLLLSEAPVAKPFVTISKRRSCSKRARDISDEWCFLCELLRQYLPFVPSPKLISERLAFNFRGNEYILPHLQTPSLFRYSSIDIGVFVKTFLSDNQQGKKSINHELVDEALKEFTVHGFPGSTRRFKTIYQRWYSECDCFLKLGFQSLPAEGHNFNGQDSTSLNGRVEILKRNGNEDIGEVHDQNSTESVLIHYEVEAQSDVYVRTTSSGRIRRSYQNQFFKHLQAALASEDCALSIILPKKKQQQQVNPAQLFEQICQLGTKGLANAFQRNDRVLILVYQNPHLRDKAFQMFSPSETIPGMNEAKKIRPATPRRYITWTFQMSYHVTTKELLYALNAYFWGSGFSSRCVISWTGERHVKYFITFEHTPPYFGNTLARPNKSALAVFEVKQSISITPPEATRQQTSDARNTTSTISQEDTSSSSGEDSGASGQEDSSESQSVNDEQESESPSEASDDQEDESSSEDETVHDNNIQVRAISKRFPNPIATDASKGSTQKATTSQAHRASPSKKPTLHVHEKQEVNDDSELEIASSHPSASSSEQSESSSDSSASSEKSNHVPSHAQKDVATTVGTKRKRTDSPFISSSDSSSNTHSTTISKPTPLSTQPTVQLLPKALNAPSQPKPRNSISQPKDPKHSSFPIGSASKPPPKTARLATKDEDEEDPLALLERHVEEYAARLKREATS